MKEQTHEVPGIVAAAERQMQAWVKNEELADRRMQTTPTRRAGGQLGRYITISREAGAQGGKVAELVGQALGWEVLDKNLLDCVAQGGGLSKSMLEFVDETTPNWAYDILGAWLDHGLVTHEKYLVHLGRIVLRAARRGNVVVVGRGARFLLPRDQGLAVRIIASEKYRVAEIMRRERLDEPTARRRVSTIDEGRRKFVQRSFGHDLTDPHLYDLVINVERLGPTAAAAMIVAAQSGAFPHGPGG